MNCLHINGEQGRNALDLRTRGDCRLYLLRTSPLPVQTGVGSPATVCRWAPSPPGTPRTAAPPASSSAWQHSSESSTLHTHGRIQRPSRLASSTPPQQKTTDTITPARCRKLFFLLMCSVQTSMLKLNPAISPPPPPGTRFLTRKFQM